MKKQRGITLIALIITIIVLLILAGVALNSIFGQGSLIGNAQNAVDEYNKKVEEEKLALEQIEEYFKNNGDIDSANLQLVDKGESWIKVKVVDENYENYQFSIDNGEYVQSDTAEYTFSNLEVTTVTKTLEAEEGATHIIKAKATNKSTGEVEELNNIQVATDVLVESDQVPYFKYEDNGEGITITELVPFSEIVTDTSNYDNWKNFFNNLKETIVVPSYIDNKPVTNVTSKFIKQVANIDTFLELQEGKIYIYISDGSSYQSKEINFSDIESNGGQMVINLFNTPETEFNYKLIVEVENQIAKTDISTYKTPVNLSIQNGIVKNGDVKLILPPTLKQINNLNTLNLANLELYSNTSEPEEPDEGLDEPDQDVFGKNVDAIVYRQLNNANINNTTIYMLGQTAQEKQMLKDQIDIDWNTYTQVKIKE